MKSHVKGAVIATAVAGLFIATASLASAGEQKAEEAKVHCEGINACKGQGACGGAGHDCAGKNACKGKGWIETSAAECTAKGGTVKN